MRKEEGAREKILGLSGWIYLGLEDTKRFRLPQHTQNVYRLYDWRSDKRSRGGSETIWTALTEIGTGIETETETETGTEPDMEIEMLVCLIRT
jgi:hypothetical protein